MTELSDWWLRRMVAVQQPIHEKLTLLWHNHFATSAEKVRFAAHMAAQNQKLRSLSLGDFRTLAYAMLTDAAMLHWLDAQTNTAKAPNENLAREFMELFALGHGNGYTEDDVRQGARALTGWVIRPDRPDDDGAQAPRPHGQNNIRGHAELRRGGILRHRAGPAEIAAIRRRTAVAAAGLRYPAVAAGARPLGHRLRPAAQSAGADARDPHRRRIRQQPGGDRQHAGRVACRGDPHTAGSDGHPSAAEDGRQHAASAGPATVLPTGCRWMAARPGLDVDRQRRRADARREPIGPRR